MTESELERRASIVLEQFDGIQPMHLAFYARSILYSADRSLSAFGEYDLLLRSDELNPNALVSCVQEAIGHAAALSRYFWPTRMGDKKKCSNQIQMRLARGATLRKVFSVTEDSPLYSREMRNAWEHFDEKLDTYLLSHDSGIFFPDAIIDDHTLADETPGKIFKLIDPRNQYLVLLGRKFAYGKVRAEVARVMSQLHEVDQ